MLLIEVLITFKDSQDALFEVSSKKDEDCQVFNKQILIPETLMFSKAFPPSLTQMRHVAWLCSTGILRKQAPTGRGSDSNAL